jgi:hypothetical protein
VTHLDFIFCDMHFCMNVPHYCLFSFVSLFSKQLHCCQWGRVTLHVQSIFCSVVGSLVLYLLLVWRCYVLLFSCFLLGFDFVAPIMLY